MTFSPHSPSVPLFHSLGSGTVEQGSNQWNSQWNTHGTSPLKALANKVLERNNKWNKSGTEVSKSVPPLPQSSTACGTKDEDAQPDKTDKCPSPSGLSARAVLSEDHFKGFAFDTLNRESIFEDFEERLAIAEYDGHQSSSQAQRIAYLDAFMAVLATLPQEEVSQENQDENWLNLKINAARKWLKNQGMQEPG